MTGVLVTRPEPGATETASALIEFGYRPILAPLMKIEPVAGQDIDLSAFDAVAVTSANGVRALGMRCADRTIPLFAVGERTATLAREMGFTQVQAAAGDVSALSTLLSSVPGLKRVLHVAGADVAGDLCPDGVAVTRITAYHAVAVAALPKTALAALRGGQVAYVTLFSPRTADLFVRLAQTAGLSPLAGGWSALCLSAAVAAMVQGFGFAAIQVAVRPDASSLLALLPTATGSAKGSG